jgi:hypothetical protein
LEINARSSDVIFITIFGFQDLFGASESIKTGSSGQANLRFLDSTMT